MDCKLVASRVALTAVSLDLTTELQKDAMMVALNI